MNLSIKKYFKSFIKSEVSKNTSILISGTLLAQLIPIALQPILRRQLDPEIFGAYSVYLSLLGILIVISSCKYELAIILPKKKKEASNILFLSIALNLLFNILLTVIIFIWKNEISAFLNLSNKYENYLYFVPFGTFFYNLYQSLNFWLVREKMFFAISKNKFIRRISEGIGQISFSLITKHFGLIFGDLIGHIANNISALKQVIKSGFLIKQITIPKLKYIAKKYAEYPKYNLIPSLMSACSYLLPAIFINKFYSQEYTGFFDLSKMVLSIPLALIATSISNVLLQRIAEKYKTNESIYKELLPVFIIVGTMAVCEIIVISLFGKNLFEIVFGAKNSYSGEISEILVWSYAFNFIIASFSSLFIAMKQIKYQSIWQLFYFIAILSLILFRHYEFESFIKIFIWIEIICYILASLLLIYILLHYEKKIRRNTNIN